MTASRPAQVAGGSRWRGPAKPGIEMARSRIYGAFFGKPRGASDASVWCSPSSRLGIVCVFDEGPVSEPQWAGWGGAKLPTAEPIELQTDHRLEVILANVLIAAAWTGRRCRFCIPEDFARVGESAPPRTPVNQWMRILAGGRF